MLIYFLMKKYITNTKVNKPTKPALPIAFTMFAKFPIISISKTKLPVNNCHKIVTGTIAILKLKANAQH